MDVQEAPEGLHWASDVPGNISAYQSRKLAVDGAQGPVKWSFSGPDESCYTAEANRNEATITCYYPSPAPLAVSVTDGMTTLTVEIRLTGR